MTKVAYLTSTDSRKGWHPYAKEFLTPELKAKLYEMYFQRSYPNIDPQTLTKEQWHSEAQTVVDWIHLVCLELQQIKDAEEGTNIIDLDFKRAWKGWKTYFDANNSEKNRREMGTTW